jgi:hypothetical protein
MATIMFDNYVIRSESNVEFISSLSSSLSFNEFRYKCAVNCIMKNKSMSFILSWKRKQYQVRINKGMVTMLHILQGEWTPLEPPFDQYFHK